MRYLILILAILITCSCGGYVASNGGEPDSGCHGSFVSDGDECTLKVDCEDGRWWRVHYISGGIGKTSCSSSGGEEEVVDGGLGCKTYKDMNTFSLFASSVCWDNETGIPYKVF